MNALQPVGFPCIVFTILSLRQSRECTYLLYVLYTLSSGTGRLII